MDWNIHHRLTSWRWPRCSHGQKSMVGPQGPGKDKTGLLSRREWAGRMPHPQKNMDTWVSRQDLCPEHLHNAPSDVLRQDHAKVLSLGPQAVNRETGSSCYPSSQPPGATGLSEKEADPWAPSLVKQQGNPACEVLSDHPALGFQSQESVCILTVEVSDCWFSFLLSA